MKWRIEEIMAISNELAAKYHVISKISISEKLSEENENESGIKMANNGMAKCEEAYRNNEMAANGISAA
jgi:hypothetical protein